MKSLLTAITLLVLLASPTALKAQTEKSIRLNEAMILNTSSIVDEYGDNLPWVEIANCSYTTYDIRGMYITTDRRVLDKNLSVPERVAMMSLIPNNEKRTNLGARQHIVFFLESNPAKGSLHLNAQTNREGSTWIALYNGNGVNLIDSVTVPQMAANHSFARKTDGKGAWEEKSEDAVTAGISNFIQASETKIEKLKRDDPHGFGITVLAMGIVFFCLALLFVFFYFFGLVMKHISVVKKTAEIQPIKAGVEIAGKTMEVASKTAAMLQEGTKFKGIDKEIYIAVIAMALKQYQDIAHDVESGIITIRRKSTDWTNEYSQMTQFHE